MYNRSGFGDLPAALSFTKAAGGDTSVFKVGESWTVTVTGPANQPVYLNANGLGAQLMGTTDSSGRFSLSGTMGEGEKGSWFELWYIGGTVSGGTVYQGSLIATLTFQVIDAPAPGGNVICTADTQLCPDGVTYVGRSGPNCNFDACPPYQTGGPDPHPIAGPGSIPAAASFAVSGGIPTWMLIAAGVGALLLFGGRR